MPKVFEMYTAEELAARTGYSVEYVKDLSYRQSRPIPEGFKKRVCAILGKTEAELFGESAHVD